MNLSEMCKAIEGILNVKKPTIDYDNNCCPDCLSYDVANYEPYNICLNCKKTLTCDISYKPDWTRDADNNNVSRCNITRNDLLPESSFSTTVISMGTKNAKLSKEIKRCMIWNSTPHSERALRMKMDDISYVCRKNNIPQVISEYAQEIYCSIIDKMKELDLTKKRGNNNSGIKAAALFISFQHNKKPKTYQEVAKFFDIESHYVSLGINIYNKCFGLDGGKLTSYSDYIDEFCDSMMLNDEQKQRVADVLGKAEKLGIIENNTPTSVVAGCILYVAMEYGLCFRANDIHKRCSVSVPTINKVYDKLNKRTIDLL